MLRLKSISFSHFRGIREGSIKDFGDVNILIGRNNSGKSTVAEAVMRLADALARERYKQSPRDYLNRSALELWAAARNEPTVPFSRELWYRQDQSHPIELTAQVHGSNKGEVAVIYYAVKGEKDKQDEMPSIQITNLSDEQVRQFVNRVMAFRPLDAINAGFEGAVWDQVMASRGDKILTRLLNEIFMLGAEGIQFLSNRLKVLFPEHTSSLDVQGDGTRAALRCLMVLTLLRNTLFILEEPECHQHAGSLERFATALCTLAKEREVQLSISTHSGECLRAFLAAAKQIGSESAVFHLKLENGLLDATRLETDAVQTLQDTGVDVRFLDLYG